AHLGRAERHEVAAAPQDAAARDAARRHGDQLEHRQRGDRLAGAGLADHAEGLAAGDLQIDAVDRVHDAVVGPEIRLQSANFEQTLARGRARGLHAHGYITFRGSSVSRNPSPTKLSVSTVRKIAAPGNRAQCGATSRLSLASKSRRPQLGMSGGKPRPRNESVDSAMIAAATSMVPATSTGPMALGSM